MLTLTFLKAANGTPMVKKITPRSTTPYPMIKEVTSHTANINEDNWPEELITLLRKEATRGSGLLKGSLLKKLNRESRANHTDKTAPTRLLVIDVDDLVLPSFEQLTHYDEDALKQATEAVLTVLPKFLRSASYVVNASASQGIKRGINIHIFMLLDDEIEVAKQKEFLTLLNFHSPTIKYQTQLTASGLTLTYPIDRTLADNTRLIYIGTPIFAETEFGSRVNPVPERFAYQEKDEPFVNTEEVLQFTRRASSKQAINSRINEIREAEGLPPKTAHVCSLNDAIGRRQRVLTNPDSVTLHKVSEDENYVRFNLGEGDSAAYWVHKRDPRIVHNFKGEQSFLFNQADPDNYKETLGACDITPTQESVHMVFLDELSNKLQLANVDINTMQLIRSPRELSYQNMLNAIRSHGQEFPDPVPACDFVFDPQDDRGVDIDDHFVNKFTTPPLLLREHEIEERFLECPYELAGTVLPELCPTIHKILFSITGCSPDDYNHFVNWLAFIVQERKKTGTAWLFHGCQGTGKGVMYEYVMKTILTHRYTKLATQETLDDSFTAWTEDMLLVACDEVSYGHSKRDTGKLQKLKNYITEHESSVRGMRSISRSIKSCSNWMFFTNNRDSMPIDDSDRRFNISPRQEIPFIQRYPEYARGDTLIVDLKRETPAFATFLNNFEIDKTAACRPLQSVARAEMIDTTRTPMSIMERVISTGNIGPLLPIMDSTPKVGEEGLLQAQQILRTAILHMVPSKIKGDASCYKDFTVINSDGLRILYMGLTNNNITTPEFSRSLKKMSTAARSKQRVRYRPTQPERATTDKQFMGYRIHWNTMNPDDVEEIILLQQSVLNEIFSENRGFPEWVNRLLEGDHLEYNRPDIQR